jgi:hypothetical protein
VRRPAAKQAFEPPQTHILIMREDLDSHPGVSNTGPAINAGSLEPPVAAVSLNQSDRLCPLDTYPDVFGVWRRYFGFPSQLLDKEIRLVAPAPATPTPFPTSRIISEESLDKLKSRIPTRLEVIAPFPSWSSWLLGRWFWTIKTTQKSLEQLDSLINVITDPKFRPRDVLGVNFRRLKELMGTNAEAPGEDEESIDLIHGTGWKRSVVTIHLPDGTEADPAKVKRTRKVPRQNEPQDPSEIDHPTSGMLQLIGTSRL